MKRPHLEKIKAALENPLAVSDKLILQEILNAYNAWDKAMNEITLTGDAAVIEMTRLLNDYKNYLEVDLIMEKGTPFLRRQKGQLKLDNSILEEFFMRLISPNIFPELNGLEYTTGPQKAFMSLAFMPKDFNTLCATPEAVIKSKDQDFTIGKEIFFKFSTKETFASESTHVGKFMLAVLAAECKINLDKTMFQEASGTAGRLKQGVPYSKYFILAEFLDMQPEDTRLTDIDNVFLLRHAKRLPFEKRTQIDFVRKQRVENPIDYKVVMLFVNEMKNFLITKWYDSEAAIQRGSFI